METYDDYKAREQSAQNRHKIEVLVGTDLTLAEKDELSFLLIQEIALFASLKEGGVDISNLIPFLSIIQFFSGENIIEEGQEKVSNLYILFTGFVGIFKFKIDSSPMRTKPMPEARGLYEESKEAFLGDVPIGSLIGEVQNIFGVASQVSFRATDQSKALVLDSKAFDMYVRPIILDRLNQTYKFFKELPLGPQAKSFIQLVHLISHVIPKRINTNTLVVKQDDPCKYIYFVKNGQFKVIREVMVLKEMKKNEPSSLYKDPKDKDIARGAVKKLKLEVGTVGRFQVFGDRELKKEEALEKFSVIAAIPSEIYVIERCTFLDYIIKEGIEVFEKNQRYFPEDQDLRKFYFQKMDWEKYRKDVISEIQPKDKYKSRFNNK